MIVKNHTITKTKCNKPGAKNKNKQTNKNKHGKTTKLTQEKQKQNKQMKNLGSFELGARSPLVRCIIRSKYMN